MTTMILHQYATSPFSEKVRLILGYKGLAWSAVTVPVIAPKPDVVALTGGYRKTPFLQIGADVYCDTALIARVLERLQPRPTLFPDTAPLAPVLAQWADSTLFWTVVPYVMQPEGAASIFAGMSHEAMKAFAADRAALTQGMRRLSAADATVQLQSYLAALEAQLSAGRRHLFGAAVSIADFSVAHGLWFVRRAGPLQRILEPHGHLTAWLDRMLALGHGSRQEIESTAAIEIAAGAASHAPVHVDAGLGFEAGTPVVVAATDYGSDPVAGTLVGLNADEVVLRRVDDRARVVHVHFPRIGFQIKVDKTP
jgi:glutathione S-transferase